MLMPEKHMDLDKSVLMVAGFILKYMCKNKVTKVDTLLSFLEKNVGDGVHEVFLTSLTLLHALNRLDYLYQNDTLTLINYEAK